MSDAEYIKYLEKEVDRLSSTLEMYMEQNWQTSPTLGLIEDIHFFRKTTEKSLLESGKMATRRFTSLLSVRNFIKSQSVLQNVFILFDDENNIYHTLKSPSGKGVIPDCVYIIKFSVENKR